MFEREIRSYNHTNHPCLFKVIIDEDSHVLLEFKNKKFSGSIPLDNVLSQISKAIQDAKTFY